MQTFSHFFLTSVKKIQVVKGFTQTKAHETETVTVEVELNQADVEGSWTRDGVKLKSGGNCRVTALGKKHALTLSNLKKEDAGTIVFQTEGVRVSGKLIVMGKGCMQSLWIWLSRPLCGSHCDQHVWIVQNLLL